MNITFASLTQFPFRLMVSTMNDPDEIEETDAPIGLPLSVRPSVVSCTRYELPHEDGTVTLKVPVD